MKANQTNIDYIKAKNRVEKLKRFYTHLAIYIVINCIISGIKIMNSLNDGETLKEAIINFNIGFTWTIWGIVIIIHAISVFAIPLIFGADWEERKIEKLMNEELSNKSKH